MGTEEDRTYVKISMRIPEMTKMHAFMHAYFRDKISSTSLVEIRTHNGASLILILRSVSEFSGPSKDHYVSSLYNDFSTNTFRGLPYIYRSSTGLP